MHPALEICVSLPFELSLILSEVTEHVFQNNGHLLRDLNQPWLQPRCLEEFANAIHQKGAALLGFCGRNGKANQPTGTKPTGHVQRAQESASD